MNLMNPAAVIMATLLLVAGSGLVVIAVAESREWSDGAESPILAGGLLAALAGFSWLVIGLFR